MSKLKKILSKIDAILDETDDKSAVFDIMDEYICDKKENIKISETLKTHELAKTKYDKYLHDGDSNISSFTSDYIDESDEIDDGINERNISKSSLKKNEYYEIYRHNVCIDLNVGGSIVEIVLLNTVNFEKKGGKVADIYNEFIITIDGDDVTHESLRELLFDENCDMDKILPYLSTDDNTKKNKKKKLDVYYIVIITLREFFAPQSKNDFKLKDEYLLENNNIDLGLIEKRVKYMNKKIFK